MSNEKPSRNEEEYFVKRDAELRERQRELVLAEARERERQTHYMKCPKDGYDLVTSEYHDVQIEACPHCGGMWLDAGEVELIAHEDRPALLTRVLTDAFASFRRNVRRPS
jgi:Zn-finger nucleic acid-binding protein